MVTVSVVFMDPLLSVEASSHVPQVDWDTLQIVEAHDDEGRIELISENQL